MSTTAPKIYFRKYKNYVFQKAVREDIPEMSLLSGTPEPLLAERFDAGDWCYITRAKTKGNKIVNMIWIHPGPCYIRGLGFALEAESHAAYLYGGYTSPQERMKGIFSTAFREVYDILRQRGITKLYGLIEDWNQQAYDYHLRLNFKPVTRVAFVIVMHVMVSIQENLETGEKKTNIFVSFPRDRVLI